MSCAAVQRPVRHVPTGRTGRRLRGKVNSSHRLLRTPANDRAGQKDEPPPVRTRAAAPEASERDHAGSRENGERPLNRVDSSDQHGDEPDNNENARPPASSVR